MEPARIAALAIALFAAGSPVRADDVTYYDYDDLAVVPRVVRLEGGLSEADVRVGFTPDQTLLRCFPEQETKVEARVTLAVSPAGKVTAVVVTQARRATKTCVTRVMKRLAFPARTKKTAVKLALAVAVGGSADAVALTEEDAARFADMIAVDGASNGGDGDMGRRPGADLSAQIDAHRAQVKIGVSDQQTPTTHPRTPPGRISVKAKRVVSGPLEANVVLRKVLSTYMAGLKRCYKDALAKDATLTGELVLAFTVTAEGRTTAGTVSATLGEVGTCMTALIGSWRFPTATTPTKLEFTFGLVPD